ncbi:nicotinate-nucleotide--dimethylbenzimidazole phosphoribosyltransferase [Vagococcus fessus]|uniref:Nicotinate-nucleotide--dimethylbenzimidazole phosphoribosyltransferase n=1 Tax=Vagococcus fessus TaxID=120370 RepID=A0A430AD90_9ENTE|nr:nicotinate-nucleotide--dimethylbenzimidazole phosphoribosyltransferase [Vagococcus fessus]RSU05179.1 nicotinate-nucleotide--dimethylbenzimidazole phosphoribosyltransferase [Vagococcus fessus]
MIFKFIKEKDLQFDSYIEEYTDSIKKCEENFQIKINEKCSEMAVPPGAFGHMETLYKKIYSITKGKVKVDKPGILVYVSDNGICEAGVSNNPTSTTYQVGRNMLEGKAAINLLSEKIENQLEIVDVGCLTDLEESVTTKVSYGTNNFLEMPAMTREQAGHALVIGIQKTEEKISEGWNLIGTGEMGVGNTTTSAAVISVLLQEQVERVVGFGAGLDNEGFNRKIMVIKEGLNKNSPFKDGLDVAAKVGGYDILAIAGTFIACAKHQVPCVIDGVISIAGLLVAQTIVPDICDYVLPSHNSMEPGFQLVAKRLGLEPFFQFNMRLGEGSGCPFLFQLVGTSCFLIENMSQFEEVGLNRLDYVDIRNNN